VVVVWVFLPPKVLYLKAEGTLSMHFLFKNASLIWKSRKLCAGIKDKNIFLLYFLFLTK